MTLTRSRLVVCLCVLSVLSGVGIAAAQKTGPVTEKEIEELRARLSAAGKVDTKDLKEAIRIGEAAYERIGKIPDYTCMLIKRERVDGRLQGYQFMQLKIRHRQKENGKVKVPFSVYVKFLKPASIKDREVIYVEGKNGGDLIARRGGRRSPNMTVQLSPTSPMAMNGNRYPITKIGFLNLVDELLGMLKKEKIEDGLAIKVYYNAKLNGRMCTHYELIHTKKQPGQLYQKARLFVDNELRVPVYFASYGWPKEEGGDPVLLEEYTYTNIKTNVGLTDKDFDPSNPEYGFQKIEELPPDAAPDK